MLNLSSAASCINLIAQSGISSSIVWLIIGLILLIVVVAPLVLYFIFRDKLRIIFRNKFWTAVKLKFVSAWNKIRHFFQYKVWAPIKNSFLENERIHFGLPQEQPDTENTVNNTEQPSSVTERMLTGIHVDAVSVQRIFIAGDNFNCSGLVVRATYNLAPTSVILGDVKIVDNDTYIRLKRRCNPKGVYLVKPHMGNDGEKIVTIYLEDYSASYTIYVKRCLESADDFQSAIPEAMESAAAVVSDETLVSDTQRELTGILIDTDSVRREFITGEKFDYEGLLVWAVYNTSPMQVSLSDYYLVDKDCYLRLTGRNNLPGVYVIKPDMSMAGEAIVTVAYEDKSVNYTIFIKSATVADSVVAEDSTVIFEDQSDIIYIEQDLQSVQDESEQIAESYVEEQPAVVEEYIEVNRQLLSISINTDNSVKEFVVGEAFNCNGIVVTAHFSVEPFEEIVADFSVSSPDMNSVGSQTVVVTYRDKTAEYQVTVKPASHTETTEVDSEDKAHDVVTKKPHPVIIEEDTVDTRLRYDKSFMARLIQSEDEVKYWYTDLKNDILSYKGVKGRISWKRETFKCGGKLVLAKLSYRGKVLCLFLPLNPMEYQLGYPVEDASDASCYLDTPLMLRIKNPKRMEIARELICIVMKKNNMTRVPHESVDYYVPYEGILDLINKGYARRNIRTAEEEAIFDRDLAYDESLDDEADTVTLTEVAPGIYVTKKD